ncbi:MAG TPA: L-rhamnose/proton symporter RhaT, partial [Cyclobacteriaceae bacterium]
MIVLGIIFHFIGGFASGSFYMAFKKVKGWAWESYWIIGGLFSWLIVPPLAAYLTLPGFSEIISQTPTHTLLLTYTMGLLWGIGGLTYGLGIRYLGMSLGNAVILGYCAAFGSLIPAIYYFYFPQEGKTSIEHLLNSSGGQLVLKGIAVCLLGIFICGYAGIRKEKELPQEQKKSSISEFNLFKGLLVATVSGILSACFNFGIEAGKPMANIAVAQGLNPLFQNNVTYVVLLWGGLTTNFIWCLVLNFRNKTFGDYTN